MILQTLSNIWIRKHIFYSFIKNVRRCYRRVKPGNYFAHHNLTSSAQVIDLCCSTSVDDIATNEVIDIFDFLVFNNCWYVFDSLCLWQSFLPAYLHEKSVLHTEQWALHSTFWDEWRHGHWLWYESLYFCCDFLLFLGGVRWSLSPSSTKSLHVVDASWLTFFNVLKQALFVRNCDQIEVFRNHNIS
jgi:hypothetical protein